MLRKVLPILFVGLFAAGFALAAEDQELKPMDQPPAATTPAPSDTAQISGVVEKIDLQNNTIIVRADDAKSTQEISLSSTTAVNKSGGLGTLSDVKTGDHVMLEVDSTNTVTSLSIQPPSEQ